MKLILMETLQIVCLVMIPICMFGIIFITNSPEQRFALAIDIATVLFIFVYFIRKRLSKV